MVEDFIPIGIMSFVVPAVTALILLVKKNSISEFSVTNIGRDITEVKAEIKEQRKDLQGLSTSVNNIVALRDRIKRIEEVLDQHDKIHWPRFENALRQIDVLKVKVETLEGYYNNETREREWKQQHKRQGSNNGAV